MPMPNTMGGQGLAPACRTVFFAAENTEEAAQRYAQKERDGETPVLMCEHAVAERYPALRALDLGNTPEEMASNLYAHLRTAEKTATVLIGIDPKERGGVMDGVRNRMLRAFGRDAKERHDDA